MTRLALLKRQVREYLGFDDTFVNDRQICEDLVQLRHSRDFSFIDEFYGQGKPDTPEVPELPIVEIAPIETAELTVPVIPQFTLQEIERSKLISANCA